jgi:vancomycin resistance protein YoaR
MFKQILSLEVIDMRKNKLSIILSILFFIIVFLAGCKGNKSLSLYPQGESNTKNNKPSATSENISNNQQEKPKSQPPAAKIAEPPKVTTPPKKVEPPKRAPVREEVNENVILSSFSTTLLDSEDNRVSNIRLAAKNINSYVLGPGEVFSFNKVVGERNYQKGYKDSKILVNGERGEGIGGGICQLSSTLYNAAKKLDLVIIERHNHSNEVHYVPVGQDAAVNYGYKDLRFKNTRRYPIKFRAIIENGKVNVSILKTK